MSHHHETITTTAAAWPVLAPFAVLTAVRVAQAIARAIGACKRQERPTV